MSCGSLYVLLQACPAESTDDGDDDDDNQNFAQCYFFTLVSWLAGEVCCFASSQEFVLNTEAQPLRIMVPSLHLPRRDGRLATCVAKFHMPVCLALASSVRDFGEIGADFVEGRGCCAATHALVLNVLELTTRQES